MKSNGTKIALNAFKITNAEELSWPVVYYTVRPATGKKPLERGDAKTIAFEAKRQFKGNCPGYGFILEATAGVVAVPPEWVIPEGSVVQDCSFHREEEEVVSAQNPGRGQLFGQMVKDGIKDHFKKHAGEKLGPLWQDYADFCEMPREQSEHGFCFCRKFVFHAKRLDGGVWAVRFAVATVALDGQSIESYYQNGEVGHLGAMVRARLDNRAARSSKQVAVRVWFDQRPNGGQGARVFDLDEPSLIISHGKLSAAEQQSIGRIPVSCLDFGRANKLAGAQLRLILDTQATLEDHDETILEPSERARMAFELRNATDGCVVSGCSLRLDVQMVADLETFQIITRALKEKREVKFLYRNLGADKAHWRLARPYHLACVDSHWYLFAFDVKRDAMRTFGLTRLRAPEITQARFVISKKFDLNDYLRGSFNVFKGSDDYEVVIDFDSWAADLVRGRRWHSSQELTELPGRQIRLRLRLNSIEEAERWVLSWGTHATVVRPHTLAARICKTAAGLQERYEALRLHPELPAEKHDSATKAPIPLSFFTKGTRSARPVSRRS